MRNVEFQETRVLVDGIIFECYPHGGIARYFREVMVRVADANPAVRFLLLCDEQALPHVPQHPQIRILCFRPWRLRPSRVFTRLNAWRRRLFDVRMRTLRPAIFHSTFYTLPPFPGMKVVATVYDLIDQELSFLFPNGPGFVARQQDCLAHADHVMSISESTARAAVSAFGLDADRITTVHLDASPVFRPATDEERASFRIAHTRGKPFFLFVGAFSGYKNLAVLIRAFSRLREQTDHFLLVAGHGREPFDPVLVDAAFQGGVEDRILRLVHLTDEDLRLAYAAADAFVYPSLVEGFGIPLVEAMRCHAPVIASDIPAFREVCGDAALYFDPHSPEALSSCLFEILAEPCRAFLIERGRSRSNQFSWDRAAALHADVYRCLVDA